MSARNETTDLRSPAHRLADGWVRFWFMPASPLALHCLRMLAGLLFLSWLLPFAGQLDALFGLGGWFDQQAYVEMSRMVDGMPAASSWSLLFMAGTDSTLLHVIYWVSIGVLVLFTLGIASRLTSILTWLVVCSFSANPVFEYGGDALLVVLSFYLMLAYVFLGQREQHLTWPQRLLGGRDSWFLGRVSDPEASSVAANLALRLFQVHFALIVVTSGLHKLQFGDWWAGVALWYPLYPPFQTSIEAARAHAGGAETYLFFLSLAAYVMLAWQLTFPLFAWKRGARPLVVLGGVIAWIGTAFIFELPLFGPFYLIGCLAFVSSQEWRRAFGLLGRLRQPAAAQAVSKPSEPLIEQQVN